MELGIFLRDHLPAWNVVSDPGTQISQTDHDHSLGANAAQPFTAAPTPVLTPNASQGTYISSPDDESDLELVADEVPETAEKQSEQGKWSNFDPITHAQYERIKKKSRSPIWSLLQIVLGGLAAIPIALAILWYGLGRDVLDAGPTIAKFAPWIVPEQFRPYAAPQEDRLRDSSREFPSGPSGLPPVPEAQPERPIDPTPRPPADDVTATVPRSNTTSNEAAGEMPTPSELGPPAGTIFATLAATEDGLKAWSANVAGDQSNLKSIAQDLYANLVLVAERLPASLQDDASSRLVLDRLGGIARTIRDGAGTEQVVTQGAAYWLSKVTAAVADDDTVGLVAIRDISSIREVGETWELLASRPAAGAKRLAIIYPQNATQHRIRPQLDTAESSLPQRYLLFGSVTNPGTGDPGPAGGEGEKPAEALTFLVHFLYAL